MRQTKYLNVILTVNAALLTGLLWTQVAETPLLAETAVAAPPARGIPDAGEQRKQIVDAVRAVDRSVSELKSMMQGGKLKVEVTNLDSIQIDVPNKS